MAASAIEEALLGVCDSLVTLARRLEAKESVNRLTDNADLIASACQEDLGKGAFETYLTETGWCANDVIFVCNNLKSWAKDEKVPDVALTNKPLSPRVRKDPLGCCLIIGYDESCGGDR